MQATVLPHNQTQSRRCNPILFCHCRPGIPHRNQFWSDTTCVSLGMDAPSLMNPTKPTAVPDDENPHASIFAEPGQAETRKSWLGSPRSSLLLLRTHTPAALFQYRRRFRIPAHTTPNPPNITSMRFGFSAMKASWLARRYAFVPLAFFVEGVACHSDS